MKNRNLNLTIRNSESGFIFLEILIAVALVSLVFVMLLGIGFSSVNISTAIRKTSQADALIREELEAVRSLRDGTTWATNGLGVLATGSANPYYVSLDSSVNPPKWKLNAGTETVGEFARKVVFDKVSRDPAAQNIESTYNASHEDVNSRKVTVIVTRGSKTYQVVTYLTNWKP